MHGPLTAITAAASMERNGGRPLSAFAFRASAPLFVGLPSHLVGSVDGDTATVTVVRNDGATAMEATGTLGPAEVGR